MQIKSIISFVSRLSKRERTIFYVTVFVVGLILLDVLILSPILSKINELNEVIQLQEEAIELSLLIVTQEERIKKESKLYEVYLSEPQITEEEEINAFKREMNDIAKKSSVYLAGFSSASKDAGTEGTLARYFIKFNFEAQMEQVLHFFHNITNHKQLLKIEAYDIKPKAEGISIVAGSMSISKAIISQ